MTEEEMKSLERNNEMAARFETAPGLQPVVDSDGRRSVANERSVLIEVQDVPVLVCCSGLDSDGFPCPTDEDIDNYNALTKIGTDVPTQKFCRMTLWVQGKPLLTTSYITWIREQEKDQFAKFRTWLAGAVNAIAPRLLNEVIEEGEKKGAE